MPDRIRALYVDDEPGLLEVARLFLEQSPEFTVETAESAQGALDSPAIASCDAIISDYQMPGMDGIAFLKAVRKKYGDIPFILFTGRGREEVVIEAINNGADFYLQKGGDPTAQFAELAHKIRQAVSRRKAQEELKAAYEQITASEEELRGQYDELAQGERRVRESQERYRSIIGNSPYGMHFYELDPARGLIFAGANPAADRILGINHEQLVGKTLLEAFPGLAETEVPARYRGVADSGTPWQTEQVVYEKDVIHGAFSVTAFRPAQGSMAAMFLDITDRKKAEMERRESEERLRTFLDSATDAFSIWDANLNLVDMNRVAVTYLPAGVTKEDVLGKNLHEFTQGGGEWESLDRYREVIRTGVPLIGTESMTELKGAKRWLNVKCFRVGDGLGIMTTDVTREKEPEEKLRDAYAKLTASEEELRQQYGEITAAQQDLLESRQQLAEIADTVPGVVYQSRYAREGKEEVTFISSRVPDIFGISAERKGFPDRFFAQVDHRDREPLAASIRSAVEKGLPWEFEGRYLKPSGEAIWFQGLARPVKKASGLYYNGVLLDITSRKRAEEALEKRLVALTQPLEGTGIAFDDLFNLEEVQKLQDEFARATGVAVLLTRPDGTPITQPSNFCRLCGEIVRQTPAGRERCFRSDSQLGGLHEGGPFIHTCLSAGLWGAGTNIVLGDHHIANWLIGQVRDDTQTEEQMRSYAREIGVGEEEFIRAFHEVPVMSAERFRSVAQSLATIAGQLSRTAYQNVQQARFIAERKRAERELRASEERLRLFIQQAPVSIALFDTEMRYLAASRKWLTNANLSDRDIVGRSHYEIFPNLPNDLKDAHRRALAGEVVSSGEYRFVNESGAVQWFTWEVRPWYTIGDTIGGMILFSEDITVHKNAEQALREKTEELDQFFTASLDLFCIAGTDGTFRRLNPEWERALGYPLAELEGHRFLDFVHPDDLPSTLAAVADLSRQESVLNFTNRYRHRDGSYRWIEWRSLPKGDLIFAAARDVTERREIEHALRESEKRYHDLFERTKAVMLIIDRETSTIVDANAAACSYYGYTPEELRGMPIGTINMLETPDLHREMDRAASNNGLVFQFHHRKKSGEVRDVEVFSAPVTIGGRELLHSIIQDVTERTRAEEALRSSEERLHIFIQQAPVSIAMFDAKMNYLAASRRWMADYNLGDRDIDGRSHYEIFPEISEGIRAIHRRGLTGEVISSAEDRFVRSDGTVQWLAWEVRPWYTTGDAIGGIIIYSEDITRQKQVEEKLRKKTRDLELYFSASIDLFCIADREGKFLRLNPEWEKVLGYPLSELTGRSFLDFVHPDDVPATSALDQQMLATNEARDHTNRIRHKDGTYRWIEWRAVPSGDRVYAAGRDITERKAAGEALRESEEKYRSLVENATEAIFILQDRHMIFANPRMAELLGVPAGNLLKHSFLDFVLPADRAFVLDRYTRRMAGEDVPAHYDFRMIGPEKKTLWVHISIAKVTWQGKPATLNLLTNITERKLAEASLKEAGRKLALLNGMTRHDIRNQLITLQGFTQFASKKERDPDIAGYLGKIDSCAKTIREQIEFMKTYQELGVNLPSWFALDGTVEKSCVKELPCRTLCTGLEVFADPMLEKVFFNLFDNARRHGEHATEVVVRCETAGDTLTIVVEDNGIGIPEDDKEKIFKKGYGKNTGFGLFLVREILSITGITIRETGTRGKGARFEILVPRECWQKTGA